MIDHELQRIIGKARVLKELRRAKERVRQLERELRGLPAQPEESSDVPEFLRLPAAGGPASWAATYLQPRLSRHSRR